MRRLSMDVEKVFIIDELAQEFMHTPKVEQRGRDYILMFDFESESGSYEWTGITFKDVAKYRHTPDNMVNEDMLKAYNAVGIVKMSNWLKEESPIKKDKTCYNHYLIYFDGFGAYEFLGTNFIKGLSL